MLLCPASGSAVQPYQSQSFFGVYRILVVVIFVTPLVAKTILLANEELGFVVIFVAPMVCQLSKSDPFD